MDIFFPIAVCGRSDHRKGGMVKGYFPEMGMGKGPMPMGKGPMGPMGKGPPPGGKGPPAEGKGQVGAQVGDRWAQGWKIFTNSCNALETEVLFEQSRT